MTGYEPGYVSTDPETFLDITLPARPPETRISVCYGYVRVAMAASWADARVLLRAHLDAMRNHLPRCDRGDRFYEDECARAALSPVDGGFLVTSAPGRTWMDTMRYAREGVHGITAGDLAYVQDYSNGRGWWTIAVKCKVVEVGPVYATVRITGESCQFRRHQTISLPLCYLRPRKNGK